MVASPREVLIRLKGELDSTLRDSFRQVGVLARQAETVRKTSAKSASDAEAKARKQASREEEKEVADSIRMMKKREDAVKKSYAAQARAAKEADRAVKNSIRLQEQLTQKVAAQRRVAAIAKEGITAAGVGIVNAGLGMARGGLMLGLLGDEKDTQKFLQTFVKIEAGIEILRGGVQVWRFMSIAVRQYNTMLAATAVAETALAAIQARRAAAGGAAAIAGGTGVGAAAGAGGGLLARFGLKGISGFGLGAAGLAAAGVAGIGAELATIFSPKFAGGLARMTGMTGASDKATERAIAMSREMQSGFLGARAARETSDAAHRQRIYGLRDQRFSGTEFTPGAGASGYIGLAATERAIGGSPTNAAAAIRIADAQRQAMRAEQRRQLQGRLAMASGSIGLAGQAEAEARRGYGAALSSAYGVFKATAPGLKPSDLKGAMAGEPQSDLQKAAIDSVTRAQAELTAAQDRTLQKRRELTQATLEGHRDEMAALNAELKARQDIVQQLAQEKKSVTERFGEATSGRQRRLIGIAERARAGGRLSANEADLLRQYGGEEMQGLMNRRAQDRAEKGGINRFLGDYYEREKASQESKTKTLEEKLKVEQKVTIELTDNANQFQEQFVELAKTLYDEYSVKINDMIRRSIVAQATANNSQ